MTAPTPAPGTTKLTAADLSVLALASPKGVEEAFANLARYLPFARWVGGNNAYKQDTVGAIKAHVASSSINHKHLAEYIAASAPLHAMDGWSYLGRALQAHLLGDIFAARHLAYYAELRASMAILAASGIAVLDRRHFVVTGPTSVVSLSSQLGTHAFAWNALEWWSQQSSSWRLVSEAVRPHGQNLDAWLSATPTYASWRPVAQQWITALGLDLKRIAQDQQSRNEASYRPSRMVSTPKIDPRSTAGYASSLWRTLEPSPGSFPTLDRHFLRITFEKAFSAVEGVAPTARPVKFHAAVTALLSGASLSPAVNAQLTQFMLRQADPLDVPVLRYAATDSLSSTPNHHIEVMSRASTLLVFGTAAARDLMRRAGITMTQTSFWWTALGLDRGLWIAPPSVIDLFDCWDDVLPQVEDLEAWAVGGQTTCADLLAGNPIAMTRLAQLELAALWGLAA